MKRYTFVNDVTHISVIVDGAVAYRWPAGSPERAFTQHLLRKLVGDSGARHLFVTKRHLVAEVDERVLDVYLPPEYRRLSSKRSLWDRFINLFKKENHHARNQHTERTE